MTIKSFIKNMLDIILKIEPLCAAVFCYIAVMSAFAFAAMGVDKRRAIKKAWRIPEARLFLYALLGGSPGAVLGMYIFRHKTKHWYFALFMPLILVLQAALVYFFIKRFC